MICRTKTYEFRVQLICQIQRGGKFQSGSRKLNQIYSITGDNVGSSAHCQVKIVLLADITRHLAVMGIARY
jgi:hypothetical protein